MTREEIIRNLKYTMEKHKNDTVNTFGTNISVMCKDILDYLEQESCEDAISKQAALEYAIKHQGGMLDERTKELTKYKKAFRIACDLLNGSILYGYDTDRIFEEMMGKDGYVTSGSYEVFILNNLDRLSDKAESEDKE